MPAEGPDAGQAGCQGVIVAQGGAFGGWSLYVGDGKPACCYNVFGLPRFKVYGDTDIGEGEHQVRMEFTYDGAGLGKGGTAELFLDGNQAGQGRVDATQPMLFSADETLDLGADSATPVSDDYDTTRTFTGRVRWVQVDIGDDADDNDHSTPPRSGTAWR